MIERSTNPGFESGLDRLFEKTIKRFKSSAVDISKRKLSARVR